MKHPEEFRAVIAAMDPDILLLDEVTGTSSAVAIAEALRELRGPADTLWNVSFGTGGGYQRSVIASRFDVQQVSEFEWIPFPPDVRTRLTAMEDALGHETLRGNLEAGLAANAAVVHVDNKKLFAIVIDFQCCGDDGTWEELRREFEAETVHGVASMALNRTDVDGVLLGGDLNLVGTQKPLQLLLEPLPSHYGSLKQVYAKHLDGKTGWTWDGRGSRFPSSQLDFAFYNSSQLEVVRAFIFDTETMSSVLREKHRLDPDISKTLSDHRPIVVDYKWRL